MPESSDGDKDQKSLENQKTLEDQKRLEERKTREEEKALEERKILFDEFRLIQDKIDKIGNFHFTVKAWAISLTTAIIAGGVLEKIPPTLVPLGLLAIAGFWLLEEYQSVWQRAFQNRCREIDTQLRLLDIKRWRQRATGWSKNEKTGPSQSLVHAIDLAAREKGSCRCLRWLVMRASGTFYWILIFLVAASTVLLSWAPNRKSSQSVSVQIDSATEGAVSVRTKSPQGAHERGGDSLLSPNELKIGESQPTTQSSSEVNLKKDAPTDDDQPNKTSRPGETLRDES